jgi:hypothetical protein
LGKDEPYASEARLSGRGRRAKKKTQKGDYDFGMSCSAGQGEVQPARWHAIPSQESENPFDNLIAHLDDVLHDAISSG